MSHDLESIVCSNWHIGAVLLAAGASRRMGLPKQSLPYGTTTLLRRAVEAALASVCHPVVVVLGTHSERITREIEGLPIIVVENLRCADGIGSSISAGVGALCTAAPQAPAVVLMLCDQPLVTSSVISRIVEAHQRTRASIVASQYDGSLGVPALFTHAHFPGLSELNSNEGAKKMLQKHRQQVHPISFPEAEIDIDTPQDYVRAQLALAEPHFQNR